MTTFYGLYSSHYNTYYKLKSFSLISSIVSTIFLWTKHEEKRLLLVKCYDKKMVNVILQLGHLSVDSASGG